MSPLLVSLSLLVAQAPAPPSTEAPAPALSVVVLDAIGDADTATRLSTTALLRDEVGRLARFQTVPAPPSAAELAAGCVTSTCLAQTAKASGAAVVIVVVSKQQAASTTLKFSAFDARISRTLGRHEAQLSGLGELPGVVTGSLLDLLVPLVPDDEVEALTKVLEARRGAVAGASSPASPTAAEPGTAGEPTASEPAASEPAASEPTTAPARAAEPSPVEKVASPKEKSEPASAGGERGERLLARALRDRARSRFGSKLGARIYLAAPLRRGPQESTEEEGGRKPVEVDEGALLSAWIAAAEGEGINAVTPEDFKDLLALESAASFRIPTEGNAGETDEDLAADALLNLGRTMGVQHVVAVTLVEEEAGQKVQARLLGVEERNVLDQRELVVADWGGDFESAGGLAVRTVISRLLPPASGNLSFVVSEKDASVLVDGAVVGVTPLEEPVTLLGGTHTITVRKEGFFDYREAITIKQGDNRGREVTMRPGTEYLSWYKVRAYSLVSLAAGSGAVAGLSVLPAVGGTIAWYFFGVVQATALDREFDETDGTADGVFSEFRPDGSRNPYYDEYQARRSILGNQAVVASLIGWVGGALFITAGAVALATLLFVENPWRYDAFEEGADDDGGDEQGSGEGAAAAAAAE